MGEKSNRITGGTQTNLSVIMPVYNARKYIPEALGSVLAAAKELAEHGHSCDLILIDDGSTDRSMDAARKILLEESSLKGDGDSFRAECWSVQILHQNHLGASAARNAGLDQAVGEYVYFFDADDVVLTQGLLSALELALERKPDLVLGGLEVIDEKGRYMTADRPTLRCESSVNGRMRVLPNGDSKLYGRAFLQQHGLRWVDLCVGQDLNFYLRSLAYARSTAVCPRVMARYRRHGGSITTRMDPGILDIQPALDSVRAEYRAAGRRDLMPLLTLVGARHILGQLRKTGYWARRIRRYGGPLTPYELSRIRRRLLRALIAEIRGRSDRHEGE